jgi:putative spermidine/putrescine transport system substrate-binding protein
MNVKRPRNARILAPTCALALVGLAGCGSASTPANSSKTGAATHSPQSFAGDTINVDSYGGTWDTAFVDGIVKPFEQATGATVNVNVGNDSTWYAQLKAAGGKNPPYDVAILEPPEIAGAVQAGLVQQIDTSRIPEWSQIYKVLYDTSSTGNLYSGKLYAVPFDVGQEGFCYNTNEIKSPPTTWTGLISYGLSHGHLALAPFTVSPGYELLFGLIASMGGNPSNSADVQKAFADFKQLKANGDVTALPAASGDLVTDLTNGSAWIDAGPNGACIAAEKAGAPVAFQLPTDGSVAGVAPMVIPTGVSDPALSYAFLSYALNAKDQAIFASHEYYGMSNSTVNYGSLAPLLKVNNAAYEKLIYVNYTVLDANLTSWEQEWNGIFG